jgi:hypothetical protein
MATPGGTRELAVGAAIVIALARFVDGPLAWLVALLLLGAVGLGALQILADTDPASRAAGVPIEALINPAATAFAGAVAIDLVPVGIWLVPAIALAAWLLLRSLALEARLVRASGPASSADRTAVLMTALIAGFGAFAGIASLVPGGLPEPGAPALVTAPWAVLLLAGADGLIGFALAYRVAALRTSSLRDVGWAASTGALVVAIGAAILRVLAIPWLLGPALLVLVFFLWEAIHGGEPFRRRDPRRLWEAGLLVVLGLLVVAWSLGIRT